jgi:hypothetical protein
MDTQRVIELMGGRAAVIAETGLTKGRISQWVTDNRIPRPWLKYFRQKYKRLPWDQYTGGSEDSDDRP